MISLGLTGKEFVRCQVRANETCSEGNRQFSDRNKDVLMNVKSLHKCWSTLNYAVFSSSSSLSPLFSWGGGLVYEDIKLIWCPIILTASSPGSLLICRSLAIHLLVSSPLLSGRVRSRVSCQT